MTLPEPVRDTLARLQLTAHAAGDDAAWLSTTTMSGDRSFDAWKQLAEASRGQGVWPVVLGDAKTLNVWSDLAPERKSNPADEIIAAADRVNLDAFLLSDDVQAEDVPEIDQSDWPDTENTPNQQTPAAVADFNGKLFPKVTIAFFEANNSWEVFARLPFGAWNDCPGAHAHVARHRDWNTRFGSDVCAITQDTVECYVARPPQSRAAAIELATEQYKYCYDIVEQGTGSIAVLAAGLMASNLWFFWWD